MTEFEVFMSANYQAEENRTVKIEAKNKAEAEEIGVCLAKASLPSKTFGAAVTYSAVAKELKPIIQ